MTGGHSKLFMIAFFTDVSWVKGNNSRLSTDVLQKLDIDGWKFSGCLWMFMLLFYEDAVRWYVEARWCFRDVIFKYSSYWLR